MNDDHQGSKSQRRSAYEEISSARNCAAPTDQESNTRRASATGPTAEEEVDYSSQEKALLNLSYVIWSSITYHTARQTSLCRLDRLGKVFGILAGASIIAGYPIVAIFVALIAMALFSADLVIDLDKRADRHYKAQDKFRELSAEIDDARARYPTDADVQRLTAKRQEIERSSAELGVIRSLEHWCYNKEAEIRGIEDSPRIEPLPLHEKIIAFLTR